MCAVEFPVEERTLHVVDVEALRRDQPTEVVTAYLLAGGLGGRSGKVLHLGDACVEGRHLDAVRRLQLSQPLADPLCLVGTPGATLDGVVPRRGSGSWRRHALDHRPPGGRHRRVARRVPDPRRRLQSPRRDHGPRPQPRFGCSPTSTRPLPVRASLCPFRSGHLGSRLAAHRVRFSSRLGPGRVCSQRTGSSRDVTNCPGRLLGPWSQELGGP